MTTISELFAEQEKDIVRLNELYRRVNERHEKMKSLMTEEKQRPESPRISKDTLVKGLNNLLGKNDTKRPDPIDTNISPGKYVGARAAGFGREELVRQIREREKREKKLDKVPVSIPCSNARELRYSSPPKEHMERQIRSSSPKVRLSSPRANGKIYEPDDELKMHKFRFKSPSKKIARDVPRRRTLPHLRSDRQLVRHDKLDKVHDGLKTEAEERWIESLHASNTLTRRQSNAFSLAAQPHEEHHRLTKEQIRAIHNKIIAHAYELGGVNLRKEFEEMDEYKNGVLSYTEFAHGMRRLFKLNSDDMFALEMIVDRNRDGLIDYDEFVNFVTRTGAVGRKVEDAPKYTTKKKRELSDLERQRSDLELVSDRIDTAQALVATDAQENWIESLHSDGKLMTRRQSQAFTRAAQRHEENHRLTKKQIRKLHDRILAHAYDLGGINLHKEFKEMDEHNSGFLTYEEFAHGMRRLFKLNSDDMFALEMLVDRDHDGKIDYTEFVDFVERSGEIPPISSP